MATVIVAHMIAKKKRQIAKVLGSLEKFVCPISLEVMREPVLAKDGHTYELDMIRDWIERSGVSPYTRETLRVDDCVPNLTMKELIAELTIKLHQHCQDLQQLESI